MAITPKLELRQSQALVMTPQLQQAIKLLQLSNLELADYIGQELESNPLLEVNDAEPGAEAADADQPAPAEAPADRNDGDNVLAEPTVDTDYDNLFANDSAADAAAPGLEGFSNHAVRGRAGGFDGGDYDLEQVLSEHVTLRTHLLSQLHVEIPDSIERAIGGYMIDLLDDAGYLSEPLGDIAARLNCPLERVDAALKRVQQFDPPGVAARNLAECLALQLQDRGRFDPAMQALVAHLDLIAKRDLGQLAKTCGVTGAELAEMLRELRRLDPKPGLLFERPVVQTLIPDVFVRPLPSGGWRIELNSDTLPRVLVNSRYYAHVVKVAKTKADRNFITERLHAANWLVKSLDQRATTVLKVATEIVRQQDAFFARGVEYLRPLNLRAIAEAIGMHESTVSRVTTNKYMSTPRGIFEFKYFFTAAIAATDGGESHSAEAVRHRIRQLIEREDPAAPLSDDDIVAALRGDGVVVARRTVAKYREAMRLPSSVRRRQVPAPSDGDDA